MEVRIVVTDCFGLPDTEVTLDLDRFMERDYSNTVLENIDALLNYASKQIRRSYGIEE